ncbi:DUF3080 family protein [Rheinheimera riviphila]|uniref:DUF3080 family protein n=1 Tax=Rheinheimera riviphila TaxID=1834037 RepID=A0A437R1T0_9GAMM|nr:DUF3080 family protein [Rheinheimera riviphila]RVU40759.1 DUF3080 family protein [Rheinheimera riviphila]
MLRFDGRKLRPIWALWLLITTVLAGCSRIDANTLFSDYQQRLSRVLDLPAAEVQLTPLPQLSPLPPLPAIRELKYQLTDSRLNLLDLVALRHCNLQLLIAERNNSLGKVMSSANLLGYELQLLAGLKPCLVHPDLTDALKADLQQIYIQKQQQLPLVLQNFLTTDLTLRKQLTGQPRLLTQGASNAVAEPLTALKNLNVLKQQVLAQHETIYPTLTAAFINQQLAVLHHGSFIADWQYSLRQSNAWLTLLNQQLSKLPVASLCQKQAKVEILNNILMQIFIAKVQSYLAELDGISHQLLPELTLLYQGTKLENSVDERLAKPAQQLRDLMKHHVSWYQQLQQQCGTKPPSPKGQHAENR